jgi:hypothetical protein
MIADINPAATRFHQLTPTQQRVHEISRILLLNQINLKEARIFITTTVSETKHLYLQRGESGREWLLTLKKYTEPSSKRDH